MAESEDVAGAVRAAYDRGAAAYSRNWNVPHSWMEKARKEFGTKVSAGMSLIDVGCGPGQDSDYWSKKGLKTVGIDISPKMVEIARAKYPDLDFRLLDACDIAKLGKRFDAAWMAYSLLHIPKSSAAEVMRAIHSCLSPGGPFFIETAVSDSTRETMRSIAGLQDDQGGDIQVPYTMWAVSDLNELLRPRFKIEWSESSDPLPGRPTIWSAILRRI